MSQKLEEHIAHLSKTIEDLSDMVATQDHELRRLAGLVDILIKRETDRNAEGGGGVIIGDERPPHY